MVPEIGRDLSEDVGHGEHALRHRARAPESSRKAHGVYTECSGKLTESSRKSPARQVCSATSRLLVHESIATELLKALEETTVALRVGDPKAEGTQMGPVISATQRDRIAAAVRKAEGEPPPCFVREAKRGAAHRPSCSQARGWRYSLGAPGCRTCRGWRADTT